MPTLSRKYEIRRAFDRAAATYDTAARVQREAAAHLSAFAPTPAEPVHCVLDAGCGTGHALPGLAARFPQARRIALDFSPAMLARARAFDALPLCADIEYLPLADATVDLYWSSLALQWCDPARALAEAARVLKPGGAAWIATLGPRTLHELRTAFAAVDGDVHVIDFAAIAHWLAIAEASGLVVEAHGQMLLCEIAADLRALLGNIKAIGAHTVGEKRRRRTLGRRGWQILQSAYEAFRRPGGALPATYDLILLALRKPACFNPRS
ncbi:MAG: methyltransferase domain-containing protein [Azoarcus sp.]|jgi:malonyl-CoA O-methyltransferase|nr:methyltransferase domain-containing protein [Azoarcus sp.]